MIRSFRDKRTVALFAGYAVKSLDRRLQDPAREKIAMTHATTRIEDLRAPPGNRLELLSGDRAGQWSIRVNERWRICFRWEERDAHDVEFVDYH